MIFQIKLLRKGIFCVSCLLSLFFNCCTAHAQSKSRLSDSTFPDAKAFAKLYLDPSEMDDYDWQSQMQSRSMDSATLLFSTVLHRNPKENELVYLTIHYRQNLITEILKHTVSFSDPYIKMRPYNIRSISFVCKGEAEQEIRPNSRDSSVYSNQRSCPTCPYPVAVTIKSVRRDGKSEPVTPTIYYLVQGAFQTVPDACRSQSLYGKEWLTGWNFILNPVHQMQHQ